MKKICFCDNSVEIAISDRSDGNMRSFDKDQESFIIKNQIKLSENIGLKKEKVARLNTQYNRTDFTNFIKITDENSERFSIAFSEKQIPISDGLFTNMPEEGLFLPLADCLGIVFYDKKRKILGLLHAGRHNLEQFGPMKFVETLEKEFNCIPEDIEVYFSPYAKSYPIFKFGNKSISEVAKGQLCEAGVLLKNFTESPIDTMKDENYPSNCSGDKTERFAIVAKITRMNY